MVLDSKTDRQTDRHMTLILWATAHVDLVGRGRVLAPTTDHP
jgi:hypothetical protein